MKIPFFAIFTLLIGCSSSKPPATNVHAVVAQDVTHPGRIQAKNDDEETILKKVGMIPDESQQQFGSLSVRAQAAYRSASGRTCRSLTLTTSSGATTQRLACSEGAPETHTDDSASDKDKQPWVFVPTVFGNQAPSDTIIAPVPSSNEAEDVAPTPRPQLPENSPTTHGTEGRK